MCLYLPDADHRILNPRESTGILLWKYHKARMTCSVYRRKGVTFDHMVIRFSFCNGDHSGFCPTAICSHMARYNTWMSYIIDWVVLPHQDSLTIYRYLSSSPIELDSTSAITVVYDDRYDDTLTSDIRIPREYDTILSNLYFSWSTPLCRRTRRPCPPGNPRNRIYSISIIVWRSEGICRKYGPPSICIRSDDTSTSTEIHRCSCWYNSITHRHTPDRYFEWLISESIGNCILHAIYFLDIILRCPVKYTGCWDKYPKYNYHKHNLYHCKAIFTYASLPFHRDFLLFNRILPIFSHFPIWNRFFLRL